MRNILLIMRQELYKILHSPGYVILAFILPVVAVLVLAGVKFIQGRNDKDNMTTDSPSPQFRMATEGYVDNSGLIQILPENIPGDHLIRQADEAAAQAALSNGAISAYYLIPDDFPTNGKIAYVYPDRRSYLDDGQPWVMEWTLLYNLVEGDADLADRIWNPVNEVTATSIFPQSSVPAGEDCSRPGANCISNDLVRLIPSIMAVLFFAAFMSSSSMLFNSIGSERENNMLEVLMVSVSPRQLLLGKTFGLGSAGILQMVLWLSAITISFNLGGTTLSLPEDFSFPPDIFLWGLVFFLGGFGVYASLMAGAGALVPRMKEAGAANYIAMIPLFIGYMFGLLAPLAENADAMFIQLLSFFPLTSPIVMMMRFTNGTAPYWQVIIAIVLLYGTAFYLINIVSTMFHTQNLLSGKPFSLKRFFSILVGGKASA